MTMTRGRRLACVATIVLALVADPLSARTQRDFDGDGRADILIAILVEWGPSEYEWSGYEACRLDAANTNVECATVNTDLNSVVQHTAPFRGGNVHQLLARVTSPVSGQSTVVTDIDRTLSVTLLGRENADWVAWQTGDFNGDGIADVIWFNWDSSTTGSTALWLLDASSRFAGGTMLMEPSPWLVTHIADFNGDGKSDLVWRNQQAGATAIWLMDGAGFVGGTILPVPPEWKASLTGDFDGDGRDDIVWRNEWTGATAIWLMDGYRMAAGAIVVADPNWTATRVANLNGDGRKDLIWRHANGTVNAWLMDGLVMMAGGRLALPPNGWLVTIADYDGDGFDDIVWREGWPGTNVIQRMNGLALLGNPIFVSRDPDESTFYEVVDEGH